MKDLFSPVEVEDLDLAKALLAESRAGFLKLFHFSPACMSLTNLDREYVNVNTKFLEKFGFTEAEVIGRKSAEIGILSPEESAKVAQLLKEKGKLQNDLVICKAKDGTEVYTVSSIERIEFNGEVFFLSTFLDITHRREMEEKLQMANKDLEAFSYSVSHDLRAPLRAIQGYVEILEEDYVTQLDEEAKRVINVVKTNTQRMAKLIDDLLEFSKISKKEMTKKPVDMQALTEEVVKELSARAAAKIELSGLHSVQGNYDLLRQVMLNLISNAIKYSSKREKPVVQITSEKKNHAIVFAVKDNGSGFDMKYADKLFGVFQRLHARTDYEGTGVGLAIVHRIITSHGGKVWAEAVPDQGATFYFSLPES